jgi:hypothetical protein
VDSPAPTSTSHGPDGSRATGREAIKLHITLTVAVLLCAAAFWIEIRRALGGNELSWAYVFEWPVFALFAGYMWWTTLHGRRPNRRSRPEVKVVAPEHLQMLKNWQEWQRQLQSGQGSDAEPAEPAPPRPRPGPVT